MKAIKLFGYYKNPKAKEKGVLSIDCPVSVEDARKLKRRFGIYIDVARRGATQERCASCVFCREVYENFSKCVFEDWRRQPESSQETFVSANKQSQSINL